jgi:glycosyltransferase involved in cell wall biosynthesis
MGFGGLGKFFRFVFCALLSTALFPAAGRGEVAATAPKISILMAIYNVEAYLAPALDSALRQSLKDIEIICVDDGSTDGSPAILRSYAAANPGRISILTNETNRGTHYSRVRAILASSGDYILWLDGDDELTAHIGERALEAATKSGADMVFFSSSSRENGQSAGGDGRVESEFKVRKCSELLFMAANGKLPLYLWNKLWRGSTLREIAKKLLPFAEKNHIVKHEDEILHWFALRACETYCRLPCCGYIYRPMRGIAAQMGSDPAFKLKWIKDIVTGHGRIISEERDPTMRRLAEKVLLACDRCIYARAFALPTAQYFVAFEEYLAVFSPAAQKGVFEALRERNRKFHDAYQAWHRSARRPAA